MWIETLRLKDFRNYDELTLHPSSGVNILYGQNGSGKTNIIESIHYCALGKSHRTSQDKEVVRKDRQGSACGIIVVKNQIRDDIAVKLTPNEPRKKSVYIGHKRADRISALMGHLQCVIFSPEDLMMIKEGPGIRRKYIDMMISQVHPVYFMELQKYQKNLDQRNAIIRESKKNGYVPQDLMDTFDEQLAKSAAVIIPLRRLMIEKTNQIAAQTYNEISGREMENFQLRYMCCLKNDDRIDEQFLSTLKKNRDEDVFRGTTSFGIHREDIQTLLNEKEMKLFASQGQIRTAALSMKLAHIDLFHELTGEDPVLLLDDVMSELDMGRRKRLLNKISRVQTFITCTDESDLQLSERPQSYFVSLNSENLGHVEERYSVVNNQSSESIEITDPDFS